MAQWNIWGPFDDAMGKGPLTLSMKISPCTEKGTSTRLFVTICDENHIMFSFNPILDIPQRS